MLFRTVKLGALHFEDLTFDLCLSMKRYWKANSEELKRPNSPDPVGGVLVVGAVLVAIS